MAMGRFGTTPHRPLTGPMQAPPIHGGPSPSGTGEGHWHVRCKRGSRGVQAGWRELGCRGEGTLDFWEGRSGIWQVELPGLLSPFESGPSSPSWQVRLPGLSSLFTRFLLPVNPSSLLPILARGVARSLLPVSGTPRGVPPGGRMCASVLGGCRPPPLLPLPEGLCPPSLPFATWPWEFHPQYHVPFPWRLFPCHSPLMDPLVLVRASDVVSEELFRCSVLLRRHSRLRWVLADRMGDVCAPGDMPLTRECLAGSVRDSVAESLRLVRELGTHCRALELLLLPLVEGAAAPPASSEGA